MKTSQNDLNRMLSLLRDHPPTGPLLTHDDVLNAIEAADEKSISAQPTRTTNRKRIIMVSMLAATLIAGVATMFIMPHENAPAVQTPDVVAQHRTTGVPTTDGANVKPSVTGTHNDSTAQVPVKKSQPTTLGQMMKEIHSTNHSMKVQFLINGQNNTDTDTTKKSLDIPGIIVFTRTTRDSAEAARLNTSTTDTSLNVAGINALELTPKELTALGVDLTSSGFNLFAEEEYTITNPQAALQLYNLGYDTTQRTILKRYDLTLDTFVVSMKTILNPAFHTFSRLAPIVISNQWRKDISSEGSHLSYFDRSPLITEYLGSSRQLMSEMLDMYNITTPDHLSQMQLRDADAKHYPIAKRLVPIYIRMGTDLIPGTQVRRGGDIYLWYVPTREFLALLPDRYRIPLQKELDVAADVESQCIGASEACQRMTGEPSYLGICRGSSGAVASATVYPNPAQRATTLRYLLTEPRQISVTLHDITGRYLTTLAKEQEQQNGEHELPLDLGSIQAGTYLVVVRTDHHEQTAQRLIVQ